MTRRDWLELLALVAVLCFLASIVFLLLLLTHGTGGPR